MDSGCVSERRDACVCVWWTESIAWTVVVSLSGVMRVCVVDRERKERAEKERQEVERQRERERQKQREIEQGKELVRSTVVATTRVVHFIQTSAIDEGLRTSSFIGYDCCSAVGSMLPRDVELPRFVAPVVFIGLQHSV